MTRRVKQICIVGGGSAGWLTAAYALRTLPWAEVTLVESPNIPVIGVGEATILNFGEYMRLCDIPSDTWQGACDASFKTGIYFPHWKDGKHSVWHSLHFDGVRTQDGTNLPRTLLGCQAGFEGDEWFQYATTWLRLALESKRLPDLSRYPVGYHVDAVKLANFLSGYLRTRYPRTLRHIAADVTRVESDDSGVTSLALNDLSITADLFIDCTGFRRIVSSQIPGSEFITRDSMLLLNAAVAGHVSYTSDTDPIPPYTECAACEHGWIWKIPLTTRIGSGLVYNSSLLTAEEAETFLARYWGEERVLSQSWNRIRFAPEFNAANWRKNCFSVGLASGFIEPLESSGLALMLIGAKIGIDLLKKQFFTGADLQFYNSCMSAVYTDSMDFVGLHYWDNDRPGPFWQMVKECFTPTDSLRVKAEVVCENWNNPIGHQVNNIFPEDSWRVWMVGSGHHGDSIRSEEARRILHEIYHRESSLTGPTVREHVAASRRA